MKFIKKGINYVINYFQEFFLFLDMVKAMEEDFKIKDEQGD